MPLLPEILGSPTGSLHVTEEIQIHLRWFKKQNKTEELVYKPQHLQAEGKWRREIKTIHAIFVKPEWRSAALWTSRHISKRGASAKSKKDRRIRESMLQFWLNSVKRDRKENKQTERYTLLSQTSERLTDTTESKQIVSTNNWYSSLLLRMAQSESTFLLLVLTPWRVIFSQITDLWSLPVILFFWQKVVYSYWSFTVPVTLLLFRYDTVHKNKKEKWLWFQVSWVQGLCIFKLSFHSVSLKLDMWQSPVTTSGVSKWI